MNYLFKESFTSLFSFVMLSLLILSACQEEEVATGDPSVISFESSHAISKEGDGLVKVFIELDKPQNTQTIVHFKVNGNATMGFAPTTAADYELFSDSPIIIKKGETRAAIEIQIIEDEDFEQQLENIILNIDGILEGNAVLSADPQKLTHVHEIEENDYLLYLEWESEQEVDLNMFIELPNKNLLSANNAEGFEEITMKNVKDQEHYFVDIWYHSGETQVNYQVKSLYAGEKEKKILASDHFNPGHSSKTADNYEGNAIQNFLLIKDGKALKVLK